MSRTDAHDPYWVRALHAHRSGLRTEVRHSRYCEDRLDPRTGEGPDLYEIRYVTRADAEAYGWAIHWQSDETSVAVYCRVPRVPHVCDVDTARGKCDRIVDRVTHRVLCSCCSPPDTGPHRAAERDWLRGVVREYNASGGLDIDPDWEPSVSGHEWRKVPWRGRYIVV